MPKFLTEESRASYIAKCAEARAARRFVLKKEAVVGVGRLAQSVEELDSIIVALQRVRNTIMMQELVSA